VSMLSGRLNRARFQTLLAYGKVGPGEASSEFLVRAERCRTTVVPGLTPEISPLGDLRALVALVRLIRRYRPHIVHTHTAKAGFVGRLAAIVSPRPRPIVVHTYHGHVLEGYFGRAASAAYRLLERGLAQVSDCLIGVSEATVDDLVRLKVARRNRFRVVPLGLDLRRFLKGDRGDAAALRARCGAGPDEILVAYVGRLVPIKRVDLTLRAVAQARQAGAGVRLVVVGDGHCRASLERLADEVGIADAVCFLGYLQDAGTVTAAADIAILSSDNEGTPVWLIEASAAGLPAVATRVGGVSDVVRPDTGVLVRAGDHAGLAAGLAELAHNPELRARMGARGRAHVLRHFSIERLLGDLEGLYDELLTRRGADLGWVAAGRRSSRSR
jgi:glycosyltransferase involved in cell wall biosynthesis